VTRIGKIFWCLALYHAVHVGSQQVTAVKVEVDVSEVLTAWHNQGNE
jgi:hypothetical protein